MLFRASLAAFKRDGWSVIHVNRSAVTFAAAANSWERSPELRERLLPAVRKTSAPIMLVHAANDYSTTAGTALAAELERLHKPHLLKIYPPVGQSTDEGHNFLYLGIPQWEPDVFKFLDELGIPIPQTKRAQPTAAGCALRKQVCLRVYCLS